MDKRMTSKKQKNEDLSANEFQEKLYKWLRDQGMIMDLRGHLRKQMINAFQETGNIPAKSKSVSFSPKYQALSTLIAEFLLQQGNNYSLSIYVTEVPFVGQLFSQFSQECLKRTLETGHRFTPKDVEDLLQTLGLAPGSDVFAQSCQLYRKHANKRRCESLLGCIISALTTISRNGLDYIHIQNVCSPVKCDTARKTKSDKDLMSSDWKDEDWLRDMDDTVKNNMKLCPITCLQEYMRSLHEEELARVREEENIKYKKMLEEKLKEVHKNDHKDKQLKEWKEKMEKDFTQRENNLCQLASQLRAQHAELSKKLVYLEMESREIKAKEFQLKKDQERGSKDITLKQSEMEFQKIQLNEAFERLAADQEAVANTRRNLVEKEASASRIADAQKQEIECLKKIQEEYNKLLTTVSKYQESPKQQRVTCNAAINTLNYTIPKEDKGLQTNGKGKSVHVKSPDMDSDLLHRVQGEKEELNDVISQQRQRIEELTVRAAELANQLQDAQIALQLATPNRFAVTTPPLTAPPTAHIIPRPNWPPHIGSGEETSFAAMRPPPNVTNNAPYVARNVNARNSNSGAIRRTANYDFRRRSRRSGTKQSISLTLSSDESTTTDELIQEARSRLRILEQESVAVQHNYHEFRNNQDRGTTSFSAVFHPEERLRNPFDGYRQTTYSQSYPSYPMNSDNIEDIRQNRARHCPSRFTRLSSRANGMYYAVNSGLLARAGDEDTSSDLSSDDQEANNSIQPRAGTLLRTKSPTDLSAVEEPDLSKRLVKNTLMNQSLLKTGHIAEEMNLQKKHKFNFNNKKVVIDVQKNCEGKLKRKLYIKNGTDAAPGSSCANSPNDHKNGFTNNIDENRRNKDCNGELRKFNNNLVLNDVKDKRSIKRDDEQDTNSQGVSEKDEREKNLALDDSNESMSVKVLLQRGIKTSSSTTQQDVEENIDESGWEKLSSDNRPLSGGSSKFVPKGPSSASNEPSPKAISVITSPDKCLNSEKRADDSQSITYKSILAQFNISPNGIAKEGHDKQGKDDLDTGEVIKTHLYHSNTSNSSKPSFSWNFNGPWLRNLRILNSSIFHQISNTNKQLALPPSKPLYRKDGDKEDENVEL